MKHKVSNIWYAYFSSDKYCELPNFYESKNHDWAQLIEGSYEELRTEVYSIIDGSGFSPRSYFIEELSGEMGWKTYSFKTWGIRVKKALKSARLLRDLLDKYPQIVSVSINILDAKSTIKPHYGDSNTFYRCHLGIEIPDSLPACGFKVNDEHAYWEEGKLLMFCDGNKHEAWNNTKKRRVILLFDVIKDEYINKKFTICINVRASLLLQLLFQKSRWIKNGAKSLHSFLRFSIKLLLILIYPYQKVFGVIKSHN